MEENIFKEKLFLEEHKYNDTNAYLFYLNTKNIKICPLNASKVHDIWDSFGCPRHAATEKLLQIDRSKWDAEVKSLETPTAPVANTFNFQPYRDVESDFAPSAPSLGDLEMGQCLAITEIFFARRSEPGWVAVSAEGVSVPEDACPGFQWPGQQKTQFVRYAYLTEWTPVVLLGVQIAKEAPAGYVAVEGRSECNALLGDGYSLFALWGPPQAEICTSQMVSVTDDGMARYPRYITMNNRQNRYFCCSPMITVKKSKIHVCYSVDQLNAFPTPPTPRYTLVEKQRIARQYCPVVYLHSKEEHRATSVDYFIAHTEVRMIDGKHYRCIPNKQLGSYPYSHAEQLKGQADAPVYAFWVSKVNGVQEITYFFFFPFNVGKTVGGLTVGSHVGDWEHVTVRLGWVFDKRQWIYKPFEVYGSVHNVGVNTPYTDIPKHNYSRPVMYCALGSHGFHPNAGSHPYQGVGVGGFNVLTLTDECDQGPLWIPDHLFFYDYNLRTGLDDQLETIDWPAWMSKKYAQNMNTIFRWGNPRTTSFTKPALEAGPTGPIEKNDVWSYYTFE